MATRPIHAEVASATHQGATTLGLIRQLMEDLAMLFRQEMALARVEISEAIQRITAGIGAPATGGLLRLAGLMGLLAAAVLGLATVMAAWLAALIVGGAVLAIGAITLAVGLKAIRSAGEPTRRGAGAGGRGGGGRARGRS